jgi:hypothetical protein
VATSSAEQAVSILAPVAAAGATITYREFASAWGGRLEETYEELAALLRDVSESEDRAGRGMLGAVVVGAYSGIPGRGFFSLARYLGREGTNEAIWRRERELLRTTWTSLNCEHPGTPGAGLRVLVSRKTADGLARTGGRRVG